MFLFVNGNSTRKSCDFHICFVFVSPLMSIYPGGVLRKMEKLEGTRRDGPCVCPPRRAWQGKPPPSPELHTVINYQPLIGVYQPTFQSHYIWLLIQFFVRCQMCFFVSSEESSGCDGARNGNKFSLGSSQVDIFIYIYKEHTAHMLICLFLVDPTIQYTYSKEI